uniref:Zinc finger BED domain-containing protein RICESLEEPER 2-like n=1 Tax=Tanacetum cinerariifolium TaxID=118510 RepID=A0A6L2M2U6_TANCI|nr:hypothetical protein [Tanacetum cinerariifolium]
MQDTGATNPVSSLYGSTTNPMQSGGENYVKVDGQSSQQSEHEYINLDDKTVLTQDTNEDLVERDIRNNDGEDKLLSAFTARNGWPLIQLELHQLIAPNVKYDANKIREAIANWLMVTKQPFSTVEDEMFIYMMKTANPLFERISRPTAKADCFKKIEYMVITGHFIDHNQRLQKRLLSFVHVPPPRTALDSRWHLQIYAKYEPHFSHLPSNEDWDNVTAVCEVLKVFKVCTNIISGSDYTTANLYLKEVYKVKQIIDKSALLRNEFICEMTEAVKEKFDEYWGECHLLMAIAVVLDPRMKMWYVTFFYKKLYLANEVLNNTKEVLNALDHMFKEYVDMHDELVREANVHQLKYPVLSKMAKDVLAIPVCTVASEATFSDGGRVIDPYRSALKSSIVEMLFCGGDWIR